MAWVGLVLLVAWLIWWPMSSNTTELRQHTQVVVTVAAVLGVNIATGYGGMISLGHGVFVGVGSFAAAYYADDMSMPWLVAIVLAMATAGVAGALVGLPALRIKGIHLALVTLGLAIVFQPLAKRFPEYTGGVSGRAVDARFEAPTWFGDTRYADAVWRYLFCVLAVGIALLLTWNLVNSRPGRAVRALRDNDTAAAVYGVDLVRTRVSTFAVSASLAGLAGALQIVLVPFASQETFTAQASLVLYATAVIGGLGAIWGSVVGVALREVVSWIGEQLSALDGLGVISEFFALLDEETFVFGLFLLLLTYVFPRGLVGYKRSGRVPGAAMLAAIKRRYRV
jgi:branched-chain amino acid transport system permease protein